MIPAATRYARASDLDHALELLAEPDAKAIAGGQSLIPVMKLRIARPSLVVDISRLELRGVEERDGELHIGPLTTWSELLDVRDPRPPCARGDRRVRTRDRRRAGAQPRDDRRQRRARRPGVGHAGGAARAGCAAPAPLARRGARASRSPMSSLGPFMTALEPQELVTDIVVPLPAQGSGSAYASVEHPASGFALAGAAALVDSGGRDGRAHRSRQPRRSCFPKATRARRSPPRRSSATASRPTSTGASSRRSSPSAHSSPRASARRRTR